MDGLNSSITATNFTPISHATIEHAALSLILGIAFGLAFTYYLKYGIPHVQRT